MAVEVETTLDTVVIEDGVSWYVNDDNLLLHIKNSAGKHIALFHRDHWRGVELADDDPVRIDKSVHIGEVAVLNADDLKRQIEQLQRDQAARFDAA